MLKIPHVNLMFVNVATFPGPLCKLQGVSIPRRVPRCALNQTPLLPAISQWSPGGFVRGSDTNWDGNFSLECAMSCADPCVIVLSLSMSSLLLSRVSKPWSCSNPIVQFCKLKGRRVVVAGIGNICPTKSRRRVIGKGCRRGHAKSLRRVVGREGRR